MPLNVNTSFKIESLESVNSRIQEALSQLHPAIKISNIEFDEGAIREKLEHLSDVINNTKFDIKLGDFTNTLNQVKELNNVINQDMLSLNKFTEVRDSMGNVVKTISESNNGLGQTVEKVNQLNRLSNELQETQTKITSDYKQQALNMDNLEAKKLSMLNKVRELESKNTGTNNGINQVAARIEAIKNSINGLNINTTKAQIQAISNELGNINKLESQNKAELVSINAEKEKSARLSEKILNFKNNMNAKLMNFDTKNKGLYYIEEFNRIKNAVNNFRPTSINECNSVVQRLNSEFRLMGASASKAKSETNGLFGHLKGTVGEVVRYLTAGSVLFAAIEQVRKGIKYVSDMDNTITALKITMNGTDKQFSDMVGQASRMADTLGSTTKDIMNVASIYANMNESISSIMDKTKADVMLSNLAGLDSKETTDAMQAFFNQFDLGTKNVEKDAMMISDSMVAVSKSMAMNFSQGIREMIEG